MALGGLLAGSETPGGSLPLRLAAVSRCFRAETGDSGEERGLYRVHMFTKVEMFLSCLPQHSDQLLQEVLRIEKELFNGLQLKYR